jgi:hypothetical protein
MEQSDLRLGGKTAAGAAIDSDVDAASATPAAAEEARS